MCEGLLVGTNYHQTAALETSFVLVLWHIYVFLSQCAHQPHF